MTQPYKNKLIEVALPLQSINRSAAAEKLIHVGTTSNLHAWWARRPLAACRAAVFASLVDDPGEYLPPEAAEIKRQELFALIEQLVTWESKDDEAVLTAAKREIARSAHGELPTAVDPFCGSGTIPIESLRLGLNAIGSDLNPIAVAISKALVEVPRVVSGHDAISPNASKNLLDGLGVERFRADLSYYSNRIMARARDAASRFYTDTCGTICTDRLALVQKSRVPQSGLRNDDSVSQLTVAF